MPNHKPQRDIAVLHPAIRDAVVKVQEKMNAENHPFRIFEAYRTPQRQAFLYSKGRSRGGRKVTNANAWSSFHQYGLAVDFVLFRDDIRGGWSWETAGKWGRSWERLHEVAADFNLKPLTWEKPHLQIKGVSIKDLRNGNYPDGGDAAWAEHLEDMIIGWNQSPSAPDAPVISATRPPLEIGKMPVGILLGDEDGDVELGDEVFRPGVPTSREDERSSSLSGADNFLIVHPFVHKWEGKYVDHPLDRGGPTNMGITLRTLKNWRGHAVSATDVQNLSQDEAWQIMKKNYYDVVKGDHLPLPVALAAHNSAVLHGPGRAGRFLQQAVVAQGHKIEVDGIVGVETLGGVARCDPSALCESFFDAQRAYFRGIEKNRPKEWRAFGKGWMRRFNEIKASAASLVGTMTSSHAEPVFETPMPIPRPQDIDMADKDDDREGIGALVGRLVERIFDRDDDAPESPKPEEPVKKNAPASIDPAGIATLKTIAAVLSQSGHIKNEQLKSVINALATIQPEGPELTPVNGAFGKTIGRLLDGKKTAIGIAGTAFSAIMPVLSDMDTIAPVLGALGLSQTVLLPVSLAMGAWGVLGKVDKWVEKIRRR